MKKGGLLLALSIIALSAISVSCANKASVAEPLPVFLPVKELAPDTFDNAINSSRFPVIVNFYNEHCSDCLLIKEGYDKLCREMQDKTVCFAYNTSQNRGAKEAISARYEVMYVPSFRFFCNGVENPEKRDYVIKNERELKSVINEFLEECK
ncbi:MAG: thioredoxin family protein [Candidatus Nanoarchaeia archaeon]|nr:thioredoxin family protein [Candidatus Nanoarchaeia archaeon]